jgi:hypothetical protein
MQERSKIDVPRGSGLLAAAVSGVAFAQAAAPQKRLASARSPANRASIFCFVRSTWTPTSAQALNVITREVIVQKLLLTLIPAGAANQDPCLEIAVPAASPFADREHAIHRAFRQSHSHFRIGSQGLIA